MARLPGGVAQRRELHFFWLLDGSGSMQGDKIQQLNFAVADSILGMREQAAKYFPKVRVVVHALRFGSDVQWISQNGSLSSAMPEPVALSEFEWEEIFIKPKGDKRMGEALSRVAEELARLNRPQYRPVLILVTDGHATDNFDAGLELLMAQRLGKHAIRLAVGIGNEFDSERLKKFIGNDKIPVLNIDTAVSMWGWIGDRGP
jgi:uncharacterized protein YegL